MVSGVKRCVLGCPVAAVSLLGVERIVVCHDHLLSISLPSDACHQLSSGLFFAISYPAVCSLPSDVRWSVVCHQLFSGLLLAISCPVVCCLSSDVQCSLV